ncbi:MAG: EAL domain-containing protein [Pseudomonadota bacterium]
MSHKGQAKLEVQRRLSRVLLRITLLLALVLGTVASVIQLTIDLAQQKDAVEISASEFLASIVPSAATAVYNFNDDAALQAVEGLFTQRAVTRVLIINEGEVMVDQSRGVERTLPRIGSLTEPSLVELKEPLFSPGDSAEIIGEITVTVDRTIVPPALVERMMMYFYLATLKNFVFGLILVWVVYGTLAGHIIELTARAARWRPGTGVLQPPQPPSFLKGTEIDLLGQKIMELSRGAEAEIRSLASKRDKAQQNNSRLSKKSASLLEVVRKRNEKLATSSRIIQATFESIEQGVLVVDSDLTVLTFSKQYLRILELPDSAIKLGEPLEDTFCRFCAYGEFDVREGETFRQAAQRRMEMLGAVRKAMAPNRYIRSRRDDRYVEAVSRILTDGGMVITITDVTEQERAKAEIERLAWTDKLTSLRNRNKFRSSVIEATNAADDADAKLAVILIDLDRFKMMNDTYGHEAGDAVLVEVAQRIKKLLPKEELVFRLGGDEFAACLPFDGSVEKLKNLSRALIDSITKVIVFEDRELAVGASIGLAYFPDHDRLPEELLRKADIALYEAKEAGRGQYRIYDSLVDKKAQDARRIENDLKFAAMRSELELYFQPIVHSEDYRVVGAEALVRWHHPTEGMLLPQRFISVLERSTMVFEFGDWIIREGWRCLERWTDEFGNKEMQISVNVSSRQFFNAGFIELLQDVSFRRPDLIGRFELELTEETMIENMSHAVSIMQTVGDMGFPIAIDDFGTGYSSISYLDHLPVGKIKIDKSFLDSLRNHDSSHTIIRSIINLGHGLDMTVTAEGVETQEQADFLQKNACEFLQGYLFGKPQTAAEFETAFLLRAKRSANRA